MITLRVTQLATIELLKTMIREMHPDTDDHWRQDHLMNLIDQVQQLPNIRVLNLMAPPVRKITQKVSSSEKQIHD